MNIKNQNTVTKENTMIKMNKSMEIMFDIDKNHISPLKKIIINLNSKNSKI